MFALLIDGCPKCLIPIKTVMTATTACTRVQPWCIQPPRLHDFIKCSACTHIYSYKFICELLSSHWSSIKGDEKALSSYQLLPLGKVIHHVCCRRMPSHIVYRGIYIGLRRLHYIILWSVKSILYDLYPCVRWTQYENCFTWLFVFFYSSSSQRKIHSISNCKTSQFMPCILQRT